MRAGRGLAVVVVLGLAVAGALGWSGWRSLDQPLARAPLSFTVAPGAPFAKVAAELAAQGVVAQPKAWALYARWKGVAAQIKAGEYEIDAGSTPRSLLDKMVSGQVVLHSLTIVDGWRVADLLVALRKNPDVVATLPAGAGAGTGAGAGAGTGAGAGQLMDRLGFPGLAAEGQFLPETYRFTRGTTDLELLRQAHAALTRVLEAAWAGRAPTPALHSPEELLIMASIVQKESGVPQELPKIAGLYLHRLSIGMRLQADPTVIYGLGEAYDGTLHSVDLRTDGAYNTYTRAGLPPTPIALAGAPAILAVAHPEPTDALYFVASGNGDGSHVFSATLEEQNAAVARYLARQREKAGEAGR